MTPRLPRAERDRSVLLLLTGGFTVWLALSGTALNFVRPSMRPYVLLAGLVVVLLAALPSGGAADHEHEHSHDAGVGWLLVVPLLVVLLVPPAPLGANAVRARLASGASGEAVYPAVGGPVRGAVPMTMAEFATRALRDERQSLRDVRVRLVGFVSEPGGGTYHLTRFVIFCCAADAEAVAVTVTGDAEPRRADQWLAVEGTWVPSAPGAETATIRISSVRAIKRPRAPYEYTTVWTG